MISGRIITLLCTAALAASFASHAQTNVYRWVDKDGKVHFSDTPPPPDAKQATQKRMGSQAAESAVQMPYETQLAMRRNPVTLYTSSNCGELCAQGRELLTKRGVPYSERNAEVPAEGEEVKKLIGKLEVPVLRVGEKHVKGYREDLWQAALDGAGYARSPLPGQKVPPAPPVPEPPPAPAPDQQPAASAPENAPQQAAPTPARAARPTAAANARAKAR
ncbi:MAG TPA: glutaredoxin family protein [Usitatibacter sp.]|nr:glutaredoxin family protein [Usitatibacter sp.]